MRAPAQAFALLQANWRVQSSWQIAND